MRKEKFITLFIVFFILFLQFHVGHRDGTHTKKERKYNKILTLNMLELGIFRVLYK